MPFALIALAALIVGAALYEIRHAQGAVVLDATLPAAQKAAVAQALATQTDPAALRSLAASLAGYPKAQAALTARAAQIEAAAAKAAATINALMLQIGDPHWQAQTQAWVLQVSDPSALEALAGFMGPGEPTAAQVLELKVAALQGATAFRPPPPPPAVNSPAAFDLFGTGQYQGSEPTTAMAFGSNPGAPYGLDASLATMDPAGLQAIGTLLTATPAQFAALFPNSGPVVSSPAPSLAAAIVAAERLLRAQYPALATSLRYKAAYLGHPSAAVGRGYGGYGYGHGGYGGTGHGAMAGLGYGGYGARASRPSIVGYAAPVGRRRLVEDMMAGRRIEDQMAGRRIEDQMGGGHWVEDQMGMAGMGGWASANGYAVWHPVLQSAVPREAQAALLDQLRLRRTGTFQTTWSGRLYGLTAADPRDTRSYRWTMGPIVRGVAHEALRP